MRWLALLGTSLAAACASPPGARGVDDATALAAAESAFAAQSVREGLKPAFLAWLAPDAILFRDGPVNGPVTIAAADDPPIVLEWRPVYVETAASGEMGLSTGPWRITRRDGVAAPPRHGQFISVWTRAPGGPWRVQVDLGITHDGPALWDAATEASGTPTAARHAAGTLAQAEAAFATIAQGEGHAAAYAAWGSRRMRTYREGHAPFLGIEATLAAPAAQGHAAWTLDRHATSASGDFGYAIGRYGPALGPRRGDYLRVWRREADGWRIALDVVDAVRPK